MAPSERRDRGADAEEDEEGPSLAPMQKMAILFVALGQESSGEVMKFLSDYEIEEITQAVANLKNVTVKMQDDVLQEFEEMLMAGEWVSQGGIDFARGALERGEPAVTSGKQELFEQLLNRYIWRGTSTG